MVSGVEKLKDFFGSTIESKDTQNMLKALNTDPTAPGAPSVVDTGSEFGSAAKASDTPVGRIKGWKERLDLMRKQKAQQIEESRITNPDSSEQTQSKDNSEANKTLTDIFAPAAGLERNAEGKFQVDKEKVETKKEIEYEKKDEDLVQAELKAQKNKKETSAIQEAEKLGLSPNKPKTSGMQGPTRVAEPTSKIGGIKKPSGLAKPTGTVERRQTLVEKQKMLKEKMAEKEKKDADGGKTSRVAASRFGGGTARAGAASRNTPSKVGTTSSRLSGKKEGETPTTTRSTLSRVSTSSRLTSGRNSIRPGESSEDGGGSATKREGSATRGLKPQFGRGSSATRGDKELAGVKARGRSGSRDAKDLQFGKTSAPRDRSKSKEGPGMNFKSAALASKVAVPEDS